MVAFPLDAGEIFADRYRIIRVLASGGMGAVYEAVHTVTERRCALKVMLGHTAQREKLRERFMLESKLAAQIGSEYIVDILDAGVDDRTHSPYLVMELLEGEDLAQRLVRLGRFSPAETVLYLWHAALGLDRTHRASIVHRDLKASNLFLTTREDGSPLVKVLDFGVAKVMLLEAGGEGHTQTVGTPIYMAPEQFRAGGRISPATDIYALGMLAYTMLVGSHYWASEHQSSDNPFAFASIAVKGPMDPATERAQRESVTLPDAFDEWFERATSRVPGERFASATEAVEELAEVLGLPPPSVFYSTNQIPTPAPGNPPLNIPIDETVDSKSAVLSGEFGSGSSGPRHRTDGSLSGPGAPPPPERTEISLSVTSGELDFEAYDRKRRRARIRLGALALGTVILVGAAALIPSRFGAPTETTPGTTQSSETTVSPERASTPPSESPPSITPTTDELPKPTQGETIEITPLDKLPKASTEALPAPLFGTPESTRPSGRPTSPPSKPLTKPALPPPKPAAELRPEPSAPPRPKTIPRESLYGQD
jgi:eukaryotic-like serine/threonine-protein kinase